MIHDAVSRNRSGHLALTDFNIRISPKDRQYSSLSSIPVLDDWQPGDDTDRLPTIEEATSYLIRQALKQCGNNQSAAARMLGISRQRLARNSNESA